MQPQPFLAVEVNVRPLSFRPVVRKLGSGTPPGVLEENPGGPQLNNSWKPNGPLCVCNRVYKWNQMDTHITGHFVVKLTLILQYKLGSQR